MKKTLKEILIRKQNFFPEKYLKQTVLTTPANINKPTVPGMQGNN